jgi:hypothetical protein
MGFFLAKLGFAVPKLVQYGCDVLGCCSFQRQFRVTAGDGLRQKASPGHGGLGWLGHDFERVRAGRVELRRMDARTTPLFILSTNNREQGEINLVRDYSVVVRATSPSKHRGCRQTRLGRARPDTKTQADTMDLARQSVGTKPRPTQWMPTDKARSDQTRQQNPSHRNGTHQTGLGQPRHQNPSQHNGSRQPFRRVDVLGQIKKFHNPQK